MTQQFFFKTNPIKAIEDSVLGLNQPKHQQHAGPHAQSLLWTHKNQPVCLNVYTPVWGGLYVYMSTVQSFLNPRVCLWRQSVCMCSSIPRYPLKQTLLILMIDDAGETLWLRHSEIYAEVKVKVLWRGYLGQLLCLSDLVCRTVGAIDIPLEGGDAALNVSLEVQ